jgi:hypothetical protein
MQYDYFLNCSAQISHNVLTSISWTWEFGFGALCNLHTLLLHELVEYVLVGYFEFYNYQLD